MKNNINLAPLHQNANLLMRKWQKISCENTCLHSKNIIFYI